MISLQFDLQPVFDQLDGTILGIEELVSPNTKTQLAQAIFTITSKEFLKDFRNAALSSPQRYFHMYEWNAVGDNNQKLFTIKKIKVSNGDLRVNIVFNKSKTFVPIPSQLKVPNAKTGKSVTKKSIFRDKASIMESGIPVTFTTKQYIAFLSAKDNNIHFIPPSHIVQIMNPGGKKTTGQFDKFVVNWYDKKVDGAINKSGILDNLAKSVAKALDQKNGSSVYARTAIRTVTQKYSQGLVEL
jgi:hypothetical protein